MVSDNTFWGRLETVRAKMFLVAGLLVFAQTIGNALTLTMNINIEALAFAVILGLVLTYGGLLGLYPQLVDQAPRVARVGLVLVLIPVLLLVILAITLVVSSGPPFSESVGSALFLTVFVGFAVGIVLLGTISFRAQLPSRAVGSSLLGFAAGWIILLGGSIGYGFPVPTWLTFVADAVMAISLLAIGYFLHTETASLDTAEPTDTIG